MNKVKKVILITLLTLVVGAGISNARELLAKPYAGFKIGYTKLKYEEGPISLSDSAPGLAFALGTTLSEYIRVEAEFFKPANMETSYNYPGGTIKGKLESFSVLTNLLFNIPIKEKIDIYFGGGFGSSQVRGTFTAAGNQISKSQGNFTYTLQCGVFYKISEEASLEISIRRIDMSGDEYNLDGIFPAIGLTRYF